MSGLSRTPGKRVWDNIPPRVRIPPSPPELKENRLSRRFFFAYTRVSARVAAGSCLLRTDYPKQAFSHFLSLVAPFSPALAPINLVRSKQVVKKQAN